MKRIIGCFSTYVCITAVVTLVLCASCPSFCADSTALAAPVEGVSVRSMGAAGDGKADDTGAFEAAIKRAGELGTGVYVPAGRYRITRTLQLKSRSIFGPRSAAWGADQDELPVIIPEAKDGPCIRLLAGGSVHGLKFQYDWKGQAPSPRPAAIELAGVGCRVSEVKIFGAWDGIMADGKSNVGRSIVEKCFLVDIHNVGVRMTGTWDVTWISTVEVWSPSSKTFPEKGVGFQFGKNDVLLVSDCFAFRASTGFQLVDEIPGCEIKGGTWGSLSNCTADLCSTGIEVNGGNTVNINGATCWTHFGGLVVKGNKGQVRANGSEFAANGAAAVNLQGGELVTVNGCQIRRTAQDFKAPAVSISGGNGAVITGCFIHSSDKAVEVKEGLKDVVLANNVIREIKAPAK